MLHGIFLIHGVYFQHAHRVALVTRPVDGLTGLLVDELEQYMYSGIIYTDSRSSVLMGVMQDYFGQAKLSDIGITGETLRYTKIYDDHKDQPITYQFRRDGSALTGEYDAGVGGRGISRCVLVEVGDNFFSAQSMMTFLGRNDAHTWPAG